MSYSPVHVFLEDYPCGWMSSTLGQIIFFVFYPLMTFQIIFSLQDYTTLITYNPGNWYIMYLRFSILSMLIFHLSSKVNFPFGTVTTDTSNIFLSRFNAFGLYFYNHRLLYRLKKIGQSDKFDPHLKNKRHCHMYI